MSTDHLVYLRSEIKHSWGLVVGFHAASLTNRLLEILNIILLGVRTSDLLGKSADLPVVVDLVLSVALCGQQRPLLFALTHRVFTSENLVGYLDSRSVCSVHSIEVLLPNFNISLRNCKGFDGGCPARSIRYLCGFLGFLVKNWFRKGWVALFLVGLKRYLRHLYL